MKLNNSTARVSRKPTPTATIKAGAYYRMSSDQQEESIPQQRRALHEYAASHDREIVAEFEDAGISGDATEKRVGFQRLIAAAARGEFEEILVWDQKRFGRFDMLEAGKWVGPLKDNGIKINLVADGRIVDLSSFEGRLLFGIESESGHGYLRSLSQQQLRARRELAQEGRPIGGPTPYGYLRRITDDLGHEHVIARDKHFTKPARWRVDWVVNDEEANVVRLIFDQYTKLRAKPTDIALLLNRQGVPAPGRWVRKLGEQVFERGGWRHETIRAILAAPVYAGDSVVGRRQTGKYTQLIDGRLETVRGKAKKGERTTGHIVVVDAHPPIVDRGTWDRAQEMLAAALTAKTHAGGRGVSPSHVYCLTGVIFCGGCGSPMYGDWKVGRNDEKTHVVYACCNAHRKPGGKCGHWTIREDRILPALLEALEGVITRADVLRHGIARRQADRVAIETESLRRDLDALDQKIKAGSDRFLSAPQELAAGLQAQLLAWTRQANQLREKIAAASVATGDDGALSDVSWFYDSWLPSFKERLIQVWPFTGPVLARVVRPDGTGCLRWRIPVCLDTRQVQNIFHEVGMRVELHFRGEPWKNKTRWHLAQAIATIGDRRVDGVEERLVRC